MFKHYVKSALLALQRDRQFGIINILGLAVALSAAILILLFIRDELSYDSWGADTRNLYRLEGSSEIQPGNREYFAVSPGRLRDPLANDFPSDIQAISRIYNEGHLMARDGQSFIETVSYVDEGFFDIFDVPVISGNRAAVFNDNTAILVTEAMARKYFGDRDPIGQILEPGDVDYAFRVVGVLRDLPETTHLDFDFIALFDPERYADTPWVATHWQSNNVYTYMKLSPATDPRVLEGDLPDFLDRNVVREEAPGVTGPLSERVKLRLIPVADIHLYSLGRFQMKPGGDYRLVVSFGIIAALIVFIACVNFINLATARASLRSREIALRKVVGARRNQLIQQFLLETALAVGAAFLLALAMVEFALPFFNDFIAKFLALNLASDPVAMAMIAGLVVVVALGAGLQPAVQITSVRPARVLHSSGSAKFQTSRLRSVLVMLQFAISIGLIVVTFVVASQTNYARNKDLGFSIENKLRLDFMSYRDVVPVAQVIRNEIEALPSVVGTSFSTRSLPLGGQWGFAFQKIGDPSGTNYNLEDVRVDFDTLDFLGTQLIAGRMFDRARPTDRRYVDETEGNINVIPSILSREAVRYMGYDSPEAAVGQSFSYEQTGEIYRIPIVGVVEDMHMRSLRDGIEPLQFNIPRQPDEGNSIFNYLNIQVAAGRMEEAQRAVEMIWRRHVPGFPVHVSSFEENYGQLYEADRQRGEIFGAFAIFAVVVSAIGLFSQAAYTAQQKSKEISLRKLMGASSIALVRLMVWQFSKPVLFANLLAWPVAWMITSAWLEGFAYRIDLTIVPFAAASVLAFLIAALTVSYHAMRVSGTNPARILRHD